MIVVLKKDHIALVSLLLVLVFTVYFFGVSTVGQDKLVATSNAKMVVMLDPGHGGEDPGAVSDYSGILEKDVNLIIAKNVGELLKKEGIQVMFTREKDELKYPAGTPGYTEKRKADLIARKQLIDSSPATICVSIHLNKFPQTQYFGAQTFYPHNSEESKALAGFIQESIKKTADPENKRVALVRGKPNDLPIIIFKDLKKPTCVVESGFLSNEMDEKRLGTKEYQDKLALAIKNGIIEYTKQK